MEIYENPACYEGAGAIYERGEGGEGCKGADRRQRRREGRSRSPKTSHQLSFKKTIESDKGLLSSGVEERNREAIIIRQTRAHGHTHTRAHTHSHSSVSLLASAQTFVN